MKPDMTLFWLIIKITVGVELLLLWMLYLQERHRHEMEKRFGKPYADIVNDRSNAISQHAFWREEAFDQYAIPTTGSMTTVERMAMLASIGQLESEPTQQAITNAENAIALYTSGCRRDRRMLDTEALGQWADALALARSTLRRANTTAANEPLLYRISDGRLFAGSATFTLADVRRWDHTAEIRHQVDMNGQPVGWVLNCYNSTFPLQIVTPENDPPPTEITADVMRQMLEEVVKAERQSKRTLIFEEED